jgi:hypothetical protein
VSLRRGLAALTTLVVVSAPLLTACGGGQSYCDAVASHQAELGTLAQSGQKTALLQALPAFEDLQSKAPADVSADLQLVVTRVKALQEALDAAGVDPSTYDPRHPPQGLSRADRDAIRQAAAALAASDTVAALSDVQQEVLDVCHTPLEL